MASSPAGNDVGIDASTHRRIDASTHRRIDASTQGVAPFEGDIAEIIAVKRTLSAQDLATLEAYWMSKYALP